MHYNTITGKLYTINSGSLSQSRMDCFHTSSLFQELKQLSSGSRRAAELENWCEMKIHHIYFLNAFYRSYYEQFIHAYVLFLEKNDLIMFY